MAKWPHLLSLQEVSPSALLRPPLPPEELPAMELAEPALVRNRSSTMLPLWHQRFALTGEAISFWRVKRKTST